MERSTLDHKLAQRLREVPYRVRYFANAYPSLYMPLARIRHRSQSDWTVRSDTELVIEGFGRSGSTFAVDAFELVQHRPVRLAHHTHAAAQVIVAAKKGIPTLVIVRRPAEVAASHMARRGISGRPPLVAWVRYHERILPYRDRFVVAPFEQITNDLGAAIRAVNERFGTDFAEFETTEASTAGVLERIEARNQQRFGIGTDEGARSLARPTPEREALKSRLGAELDGPPLAPLRARSERLYGLLVPPVQTS